jgi:pimeloyl-ACP methyl ester carboxylesterase
MSNEPTEMSTSRETRAELAGAFDLALAPRITVPTLLLTGADSVDFLRADIDLLATSLPRARVVVLEGQEHVADVLDPEAFAGHLLSFLHDT